MVDDDVDAVAVADGAEVDVAAGVDEVVGEVVVALGDAAADDKGEEIGLDDADDAEEEEGEAVVELDVEAGVDDDAVVAAAAAADVLDLLLAEELTVDNWSWMSIMWSPSLMVRLRGALPERKSFTCKRREKQNHYLLLPITGGISFFRGKRDKRSWERERREKAILKWHSGSFESSLQTH